MSEDWPDRITIIHRDYVGGDEAGARVAELEADLNALKKLYESRRELIAELELGHKILDAQREKHREARRTAEAHLSQARDAAEHQRDMREQAEATLEEALRLIRHLHANTGWDETERFLARAEEGSARS